MAEKQYNDIEVIPDNHADLHKAKAMKMNRILGIVIAVLSIVLVGLFTVAIVVPFVADVIEERAAAERVDVWIPEDWIGNLPVNSSSAYTPPTGQKNDNKIIDTTVYSQNQPDIDYQQKIVKQDGKYMLVIYESEVEFPKMASEQSYSLALTDVKPVTTLTLTYVVPNVTVHKSIKTGEKIVGGKLYDEFKEIDVTYPDPDARLVVKVYAEDGSLYSEEGYGGMFDIGTEDVIKFLRPGNYTVEIIGKEIVFDVSVAIW